MTYPYKLEVLRERIEKRDAMRLKLKEALEKESKLDADGYEIEENIPLKINRSDIARNIIRKMNSGDSVLVLTEAMARTLRDLSPKENKHAAIQAEEGGWRVWII